MIDDPVRLIIDGWEYTGWEHVSIHRSLDEALHGLDVSVSDQWAGHRVRVPNGAPFKLYLGDELISTGYLDRVQRQYDASSRQVTVSGRSTAQDMVDCSFPPNLPSTWRGISVLQICQLMAKPFGIEVVDRSGQAGYIVDKTGLRRGEAPMSLMHLLMRVIGARVVSEPDGNLAVVSASQERVSTPLELGKNILKANDDFNLRARFSDYRITSQKSKLRSSNPSTSIVGTSHDAVMASIRPRLKSRPSRRMMSSVEEATKAATVLRNQAAGHSHVTTYTVAGWRHADGLWQPNRLVRVVDAECNRDAWLLIASVGFVSDKKGRCTVLKVMEPAAFDITAQPDLLKKNGVM